MEGISQKNKDFLNKEKKPKFYIFEIEKGLKEYKKEDFREMLKGHYFFNSKAEYLRYLDKGILKTMDIEVIIWIKSENKRLSGSETIGFEDCKLYAIFDYMPPELIDLTYISRNSIW